MDNTIKIENILSQIKKLDHETRLCLMEKLVKLVRQSETKKSATSKLTELNGLGAEVWNNVNIEQYIQKERQWD